MLKSASQIHISTYFSLVISRYKSQMHSSHITLSEVHVFTVLLVVTFLPSTCLDMVIFVR